MARRQSSRRTEERYKDGTKTAEGNDKAIYLHLVCNRVESIVISHPIFFTNGFPDLTINRASALFVFV